MSQPSDRDRPPAEPAEREAAAPAGDGQASQSAEGMPEYKGQPLDAERGPGLGCFWFQVVLLALLLVVTPLTVVAAMPSWVSATLLIVSLVILFFVGQTAIFLLRLVAADRRSRRVPRSPAARRTVGQLEDQAAQDQAATASPPPDEPEKAGASAELRSEQDDTSAR